MNDKSKEFQEVFARLKAILEPLASNLIVKTDEPGNYYLNTPTQREDGYVYAFGGVQIKKNYVSYHLMPVYTEPALLDDASPALKKRMQGKSCFNFSRIEDPLFEELTTLTIRSIVDYKAKGFA